MSHNIIDLQEPEVLADARASLAASEKLWEALVSAPSGIAQTRASFCFMREGASLFVQAFEGIEEIISEGQYLPVYKKRARNMGETHLKRMIERAGRTFSKDDQDFLLAVGSPLFGVWTIWMRENQTSIPTSETWLARNIGRGIADELWKVLNHLIDEMNRLGFNYREAG